MTLTIRDATLLDLPTLYALAKDQAPKFLTDDRSFSVEYAKELLSDQPCRIIDAYGYAAGVFWMDEVVSGLRGEIHLLVHPEYWRSIIKQDIISGLLDWCFESGLKKVVAMPLSNQKQALKLLRKYNFLEHKPFYKHERQNGIIVDVIPFELRRSYWRKHRGIRLESKERSISQVEPEESSRSTELSGLL